MWTREGGLTVSLGVRELTVGVRVGVTRSDPEKVPLSLREREPEGLGDRTTESVGLPV